MRFAREHPKLINTIIFLGAFFILFIYHYHYKISISIGLKLTGGLILLALTLLMFKSIKLLIFSTVLFLILTATHFRTIEILMAPVRWIPFMVFTFMFISYVIKNKSLPRRIEWMDKIILLLLAAMFLSAFYSINPSITIMRTWTFFLLYISVFWVIYPEIHSNEEAEEIINIILYAASIPFLISLILIFFSSSVFWGTRFRGYFSNPNFIGILSAILLPLILWEVIDKKKGWAKILLIIMIIFLLLSNSRSGILGSVVGGGYYIFMTRKKWRIPVGFFGIILIILIYTIGNQIPTSMSSYLRLNPQDSQGELSAWDDISSGRGEHWEIMWSLFKKRPFTGYGFGTEDLLFEKFHISLESTGVYAHNSFLGIAVQMGIPGLLLFFFPLFYLLSKPINPRYKVNYALTGLLIGGLVAGFFESWICSVGNAYAFPFWAGIMLLLRSKKGTENENSD